MSQPNYYNRNGLSPLEAFKLGLLSEEEFVGFCKGNIIKYIIRVGYKGNINSDLDKAIDYIGWLREYYNGLGDCEQSLSTNNDNNYYYDEDNDMFELMKEDYEKTMLKKLQDWKKT